MSHQALLRLGGQSRHPDCRSDFRLHVDIGGVDIQIGIEFPLEFTALVEFEITEPAFFVGLVALGLLEGCDMR